MIEDIRYMSQVSYRILRICRVGFLRISERRSADVRQPSTESSLVIRGIIAGYPRNHHWVFAEPPLGTRGMFRWRFAQNVRSRLASRSQRSQRITQSHPWVAVTQDTGRCQNSCGHRDVCLIICTVPRTQHRCSADSLQTIRRDAEYIPLISAQVFTESRDGLPRNSSDFRK